MGTLVAPVARVLGYYDRPNPPVSPGYKLVVVSKDMFRMLI